MMKFQLIPMTMALAAAAEQSPFQKILYGDTTVHRFLKKNWPNPFKEVPEPINKVTPSPQFSHHPAIGEDWENDLDSYKFEIRSEIDRGQKEQWCLQEDAGNQKRKNLLVAKPCNGSLSQKWSIGRDGYIRNLRLRNKCIRKAGRYLRFSLCDKPNDPFLMWFILHEDQTIRWSYNAMMTIRVHMKFAAGNMINKSVAPVQLGNVANRGPHSNEKWAVVFDIPPTMSPTMTPTWSPTFYYSSDNSKDDAMDNTTDGSGDGLDDELGFLMDMAMQCLDPNDVHILTSTNPLRIVQNYCEAEEIIHFEKALETYEQCSGASIEEFIQSIGSAVFGSATTCLPYLYELFMNENDIKFPLPRIPEECVNSYLGDNSVGNFIRNEMMMMKKGMHCLVDFGKIVPHCTLYRWPVPIVAPFIKLVSCANTMLQDYIEMGCDEELSVLSSCLPPVHEMSHNYTSDDMHHDMCMKWVGDCAEHDFFMPFTGMFLPPPLWSRPLPDICRDRPNYDRAVEYQYETFRRKCIPKEDQMIWERNYTIDF